MRVRDLEWRVSSNPTLEKARVTKTHVTDRFDLRKFKTK